MLQPLYFALYCYVESVGICRPLRHSALQVPPLIHALHEPHPQLAHQGVLKPASRRVYVQFAPHRSSVSLAGQVHGYHTIDYVISAHAMQRLTVRLTSASPFLLMGIYAPNGEALCVETCTGRWTGLLAHTGDYTIRVGLGRAEARRQGRAYYKLTISMASL